MMDGFLFVLTLFAALGCGLIAGVFFAFSSFVMPALRRLPATEGIAVTPVFMTALFGTAASCLGLAAWAVVSSDGRTTALVLAGCALYIVGTVGVTMACNVPLNYGLAKLHPRGAEAAVRWDRFVTRWTAWNHVRTAAALVAAALLTVALHV
jgi:uncharacterized membrane protein